MIAWITHSHVQQRGGLKQGNLAICEVFWRRDAVSGEVVKGEGWEECTTSSVREPHSAVSKHVRTKNVLLSLEIHVKLACRTLKNDKN